MQTKPTERGTPRRVQLTRRVTLSQEAWRTAQQQADLQGLSISAYIAGLSTGRLLARGK